MFIRVCKARGGYGVCMGHVYEAPMCCVGATCKSVCARYGYRTWVWDMCERCVEMWHV